MAAPASPRLPSPPPIPEDQLSPIGTSPEQQKLFSNLDHAAERRIRPGTKAEDMAEGPPLVELSEIDSAFQLTEHLKALHYSLTHPDGSNSTIPVNRDMALRLAQAPENVDKTLWLYELCRLLTQKVNSIIVALFSDTPPCSSLTCPEMRASEWQYLCAVHDPPKSCCAIDYCCHTLDWAGNTLTSPKHFPSRLALGTDQSTQHSQQRQLTNIFRRVYRIFAHAWFQHREMFWKVEGRTGLYVFYKTVCDVYDLIQEDNYTVPAEAEGIEPSSSESRPSIPPLILKREPSGPGLLDSGSVINETISDHSLSTAGTTKRHRHSPSVGPTVVHTVVEENEEEEERPALQSRPATQIFDTADEESDITVIEDSGSADGDADAKEVTPAVGGTEIADEANKHESSDEDSEVDKDENEAGDSVGVSAEMTKSAGPDPSEETATGSGGTDKPIAPQMETAEKVDAAGEEATDKADKDTKQS